MIRLLQFTDLHLHDDPAAVWRGVRPQQTFERALYHARRNHWPADLVVLTGDLANEEFDDTYGRLTTMAAGWNTDVIAVPGNHDDAARMREAFEDTPIASGGVRDIGNWSIIALDSQLPGKVEGRISDPQYTELDRIFDERGERHVLVCLHHPPMAMGSDWLDSLCLTDDQRFRDYLSSKGVAACVFGHAHQAFETTVAGVSYLGTPSTSIQFLPNSADFTEDTRPPAYRWLELDDDGTLSSGIEWVDESREG